MKSMPFLFCKLLIKRIEKKNGNISKSMLSIPYTAEPTSTEQLEFSSVVKGFWWSRMGAKNITTQQGGMSGIF